jgi:hypothetical protein
MDGMVRSGPKWNGRNGVVGKVMARQGVASQGKADQGTAHLAWWVTSGFGNARSGLERPAGIGRVGAAG